MGRAVRVITFVLVLMLLLGQTVWGESSVRAEETEPPVRQTSTVEQFTSYEWWLIRWTDNLTVCQLFVDHEGLPSDIEIFESCGQKILTDWQTTPPCAVTGENKSTFACHGLYAYFAGYHDEKREVQVDLPPIEITVNIADCELTPPQNFCPNIPKLVLIGNEPLPDYEITMIHAVYEGIAYTCDGKVCEIPLKPSPLAGSTVEYWADSNFGDSSEHGTAQVRVIESGVPLTPTASGWYVDVLSPQWVGGPVDTCAALWEAFPPPGGAPTWLTTPDQPLFLMTDEPFQYLAGRLIYNGLVDASNCPNNGLLSNGYADACGLEQARPLVQNWQNQFNNSIITVSEETGLPAQLIKNIFAQESQFWPGVFRIEQEYGLGQITDQGADTLLLWNHTYYDQFCPTVLSKETCAKGYLRLDESQRALLRGALAVSANADCPECASGVDLEYTNETIMLFVQSILANCSQVSRTVYNASQEVPGTVSSFEDLWQFTLANYNGGSGCLAFAVFTTWSFREPLDWEHVSSHLTVPCQGVIGYVDQITNGSD